MMGRALLMEHPKGTTQAAIRHFYILAEIDFHLHGRFKIKNIEKSGALNSRTISAVCVLGQPKFFGAVGFKLH